MPAERTGPDPGIAGDGDPPEASTASHRLADWLRGLARIAAYAAVAVVGVLVAVSGMFVSRSTVGVLGWDAPLGMVLAIVGTAAAFEGSRLLIGRPGGFAVLGGWLAGMATLLLPRSAGDVVLANDGYGVGFGLLGAGLFLWAAHRTASR